MNREQKIAHLEIHGWVPYKDDSIRWLCVWEAAEGRGFAFDYDNTMSKSTVEPPPTWACSWDAVSDALLARIVERVTRERTWAPAP